MGDNQISIKVKNLNNKVLNLSDFSNLKDWMYRASSSIFHFFGK